MKELSVIVPAYNEEELISTTLQEVLSYFRAKKYTFEVLVVNDGSIDSTEAKVLELVSRYPELRLIHQEVNSGKGEAIKKGISLARYRHSLFLDADNSTSIREWDKFEPLFEKGAQVVIASRHLRDSKITRPQPWTRRFLGGGYRVLSRVLFRLECSDFNCGFKAFETVLAQRVYFQNRMKDWTFDVEFFCRLKREGLPVTEVAVTWTHYDKKTHASPIKTALRTLRSLINLKREF